MPLPPQWGQVRGAGDSAALTPGGGVGVNGAGAGGAWTGAQVAPGGEVLVKVGDMAGALGRF